MTDPKLCHLCNKNRLNPKNQFRLPNGIEALRAFTERSATETEKRGLG